MVKLMDQYNMMQILEDKMNIGLLLASNKEEFFEFPVLKQNDKMLV